MSLPSGLTDELSRIVGAENVRTAPEDLLPYECDALTHIKGSPDLVVVFRSAQEVAPAVRLLARAGVPFTARGAGTGLAGGATPVGGGAVLVLSRLKGIIEISQGGRYAVVEPGVVNIELTRAAEKYGLCFAPDPASQSACTIGGNVAANSGGPHTLKYGVTCDHILGLEVVLPDGETVVLGGASEDAPGLDLRALLTGSEGTLGIVTRITARLTPVPRAWKTLLAAFHSLEDAGRAVSAMISAGLIPAALEIMDRRIVKAVEESFHLGLPLDAGAILIVEMDGLPQGMDRAGETAAALCRSGGAFLVKVAGNEAERAGLWMGRKKAGAAVGRVSPSYATHDVVIPRTRLAEAARRFVEMESRHGLRIGLLSHGGDGNLHPLVFYDERDPAQAEARRKVSHEITRMAVELGGTVTGEHGIGAEKIGFMPEQFSPEDLAVMRGIRDFIDPAGLCNPGKVLPPPEGK
jgi:glycolate oxidase